MEYRIDKQSLFDRLITWDSFLKRTVHLIACGGTAMTLLGIKESTKDIDLIVPDITEYEYLIKTLKQLGYKSVTGAGWAREDGFTFELFRGKKVHTTELLESPLKKENNILIKELSHIYLGVLNYCDLIISKLFRGDSVDIEDCLTLVRKKGREINIKDLETRYHETASFDISEDKVNKHLKYFLKIIKDNDLLS